jgi:tetratricopeptide (TPR) repeat protein
MKSIFLALLGITVLICFAASPPPAKTAGAVGDAARLNNLGISYMNQQQFEKGLKAFQEAAALDPKLAAARVNQGIALLALGRVEAAKPLLEEAVKRDPNDLHAWYSLGLLYKNSAEAESSIAALRRVTQTDADDPNAWYFLGAVYAQNKQFPEAIDAFQHALKLEPLHASAEFGISRAYQQSGDAKTAHEHLLRFQHITQEKLGSAMGLAYGDQGKYSLAEESPMAAEEVLPQIPVKFVETSEPVGLVTKAGPAEDKSLAAYLGPGACFLDYDSDGKPDIFLPDHGPQGGFGLFHNVGGGKFEEVTKKAGLDPSLHGIACTAGDYDNDGATDLAVSLSGRVLLLHNEKNGTFTDVAEAAGIKSPATNDPNFPAFNVGLTFIDYDHDGDLDLYIDSYRAGPGLDPREPVAGGTGGIAFSTAGAYSTMWRNNGNGKFSDVTEETGLGGLSLAAVGTDYNNDRAVDLVLGSRTMFENPREGKFIAREVWQQPMAGPAVGVAVLDFNHDGWMDLAFTHWSAPGLTLWRNHKGKFEQVPLPATSWVRGWGVAAIDYDNDGWVDLVAVGETQEGKGEVRLFRNLGPGGFKDVTAEVGLDRIPLNDARAIITGDYDGDGATDLLITQNHGRAVLLRNQGGNKNNWLRLSLKGLNDNKSAIGTKVEVFSEASRQKFEIAGSNGYLGQNSTDLVVGLGQAKRADVVRMLWPEGVLQDEIEVAGMKQQSFTELDRRGSSCPTLFAWDGRHYTLVADMIGAGVIGHWVAPGERNVARPTEYAKLDRRTLSQKDGKFSFRLIEPMEEVVYLDQVKLLAVDHPGSFDVYPNEYFASNPPFPVFKVVASQDALPPAAAVDEQGHDVLPDLLAHHYIGTLRLEPFKGFTKLHSLELDLGQRYQGGPLWLLMHGEIEYFTATGMYAAYQAGVQAIAPYVEALSAQGKWVRVIDDIGFPAGGPRMMTADLTDKLPIGVKHIRISTNLQIYWDGIWIDRTPQDQPFRLTSLPLARADLRFHGYPRQIEAQPPGNVKYVYDEVSRTGPYARQAGTYTRYGDVRPLLSDFDDRFAVFGSGEEVALEFDPASLPAIPQGWTRDYFFLANGYEKDMDFYAADGSTVEPLPFRSMGTYPHGGGKSFPLDPAHTDYLLNYNTRHISGNEPQGYWYDYRPSP